MNFRGSKKRLGRLAVLLLLMPMVLASDTEGTNEAESGNDMSHGNSHNNNNNNNNSHHTSNSKHSAAKDSNSKSAHSSQPPAAQSNTQYNRPLYNVAPLPVFGNSNSNSNEAYQRSRAHHARGTATTPLFMTAFGSRPSGVPIVADPIRGLNDHVAATYEPMPAVLRARTSALDWIKGLKRVHVAVRTKATDQGPLGPAPHSPLEYAGWLEYLALLFGDAGNATAVRQILYRLTRLAQTGLSEQEAQKVQAATAFLAAHFQPLLESNYRQFVFDQAFLAKEGSWSQDSSFSGVFELLVDKMDVVGAQQHFSQVFGDDARYALSLGNRQPEWLQLKLVLERIAWDIGHQDDLLGLWSPSWKLTVLQKLSILAWAANPSMNAPLDANLPHREQILARVNLIANGAVPKSAVVAAETPLEQAQYRYAEKQLTGSLCIRSQSREAALPEQSNEAALTEQSTTASTSNTAESPVTDQAQAFKQRVDDYCELTSLTPNFSQLCQSDAKYDAMPISALLSASRPLFASDIVAYVGHLERLYWSFTWIGACREAGAAWKTLSGQLQLLKPQPLQLHKGRRVPSDVADAVHQRLQYMQAALQRCSPNVAVSENPQAAKILGLVSFQHLEDALFAWEQEYSHVAARLQGYPESPALIVSGESELLFAQARDVRLAVLLYMYPRAVYSPCLGRGLLTGDPNTDLTLLNLAHSIATHKRTRTTATALITQASRRSVYVRALFVAGEYRAAARVARETAAVNEEDELAKAFIACTQLCGSDTRNPCEAAKIFDELLTHSQQRKEKVKKQEKDTSNTTSNTTTSAVGSAYAAGKELAARLCRLSRNTAADAMSLRYGKVLTTQPIFIALERILLTSSSPHRSGSSRHSHLTSKLLPGSAESVLPWFGVLPPAPVADILSFAPVNSGKLALGVGIRGMPVIHSSSVSASGSEEEAEGSTSGSGSGSVTPANSANSANSHKPSKVLVLGKEYDANYLTVGSGQNQQPKIELKDGIFQLATPHSHSSGSSSEGHSSGSGSAHASSTEHEVQEEHEAGEEE